MNVNRAWMHNRLVDGMLTQEFAEGVYEFLEFAFGNPQFVDIDRIRCPCKLCDNLKFLTREPIQIHLYKKGFTDYNTWHLHGEPFPDDLPNNEQHNLVNDHSDDEMSDRDLVKDMVLDAAGPTFDWAEEEPNPKAQDFYNLLRRAEEPLWEATAPVKANVTTLSAVAELLNIKADCHLTRDCMDRILSVIKKLLPEDNRVLAADNGGQKPTINELFFRTHTKKGTNQLVSSKSQKINDSMNEALKDKYGDDSTQHPDWDVDTWLEVVGGKPHGHAYGLGSAVDSKVQRAPNSSQPQQVHQPPGYVETEMVQKLIQEKIDELEQRHKEREEEQKREFEERETRKNKEYKREMKRALHESQMMFIQTLNNRNMDGASSSRPLRTDKAPVEGPYYHEVGHQRNTHHQSNWYESEHDASDNETNDEIVYQTEDEE